MINKKLVRNLFIFFFILSIFTCVKVDAACSTEEKNKLLQLAYNIKFDYELSPNEGDSNRSFSLTISNLTKELEVRYGYSTYSYDTKSKTPGIIRMNEQFSGGMTHKVKIYSSKSSLCKEVFIATRDITIPKFNSFSGREECKEYPNFKLCNMWYEGEITRDQFEKELQKYKNSLEKKVDDNKRNKDAATGIINWIIKIYTKNLILSIIITIVLIGLIMFILIRRKKNKVKIDL